MSIMSIYGLKLWKLNHNAQNEP